MSSNLALYREYAEKAGWAFVAIFGLGGPGLLGLGWYLKFQFWWPFIWGAILIVLAFVVGIYLLRREEGVDDFADIAEARSKTEKKLAPLRGRTIFGEELTGVNNYADPTATNPEAKREIDRKPLVRLLEVSSDPNDPVRKELEARIKRDRAEGVRNQSERLQAVVDFAHSRGAPPPPTRPRLGISPTTAARQRTLLEAAQRPIHPLEKGYWILRGNRVVQPIRSILADKEQSQELVRQAAALVPPARKNS